MNAPNTFSAGALTVRYPGAARAALDGVSMSVPSGSLYAVLGPNGSGKSTLLRALMGVATPESGECFVDGTPIGGWNRRDLALRVGVVPQTEPMAFPVTVREIVALGRYPHLGSFRSEGSADQEAIRGAMARCDVLDLADRLVTDLSGGELQRVRIARALAQEPQSLALDEPTASLDIAHEMEILQLLRASADDGMTVLLVTHHLDSAARFADRMLLLDRGRVAAEGTPGEVLKAKTLQRVYGWDVDVREDPVTGSLRVTPLAS
jgi:ABC-type cobalamin/Fe3+-siderophores transport system ATPase subunit